MITASEVMESDSIKPFPGKVPMQRIRGEDKLSPNWLRRGGCPLKVIRPVRPEVVPALAWQSSLALWRTSRGN